MLLYECIRCDHKFELDEKNFKEEENKSEIVCSHCGNTMFLVPFDKEQKIKDEILKYIDHSVVKQIGIMHFTKYKEHKTFPKYNEIKLYMANSHSFEMFIYRVRTSLKEFELYINMNHEYISKANFDLLNENIKIHDKVLKSFYEKFQFEYNISEFKFPCLNIHTHYIVNGETISLSNHLIKTLFILINKIEELVQNNNFYNDLYKDIKDSYSTKKDMINADIIKEMISVVERIKEKEYDFDIFSDGTEELSELYTVLFRGIRILFEKSEMKIEHFFRLLTIDKIEKEKEEKNSYLILDEKEIIKIPYIDYTLESLYDNFIKPRYYNYHELFNESLVWNKSIDELYELLDKVHEVDISLLGIVTRFNKIGKGEKKLNELIGLQSIKDSINKIKAYFVKNKGKKINLNMAFFGNPGTGKTEVARIIGEILYENKILPSNKVIEVDRSDLVGEYVGETPQKTKLVINRAMGGVLFIDEAYSLVPDDISIDYGHEAVATLIKEMEDHRGEFCVILAGYSGPLNKMISTNPGFESRIQFKLDFPNYSRSELEEILKLQLSSRDYQMTDQVISKVLDIIDYKRKNPNFANAREIRNILEQLIMNQNLRCLTVDDNNINMMDIDKYMYDNNIKIPKNVKKELLTPMEELDELIGLENVKKTIKKIRAFAIRNKDNILNMHMCFYGNPGTGKTEVARIISRLLYEIGVLKEAKFVETDSSGLISQFVGGTGEKTQKVIDSAMDGLLFIDEAYALTSKNNNSYGDEAVAVLLKEMEDKRGRFCTILAGYKQPMLDMLASNPGFKSRIQFNIEFPDYSKEELKQIADKLILKKEYSISNEALELIADAIETKRNNPDFANAREVRNIVDQVILNQNLREEDITNKEIILEDVLTFIQEEGIEIAYNSTEKTNLDISSTIFKQLANDDINITKPYLEQSIISLFVEGGQGTGFIVSPDGYVITCAHCVDNNKIIKGRVSFYINESQKIQSYFDLDVLKVDKTNDVALLKIKENNIDFRYLQLSDINKIYEPLDEFIVIGYPFGGETYTSPSYTIGKIASVNNIENNREVVFADMFGVPGSSGSPIIDRKTKKVIGIYWGGISKGDSIIRSFTPIKFIWNLFT